jgi:hypothetical protein
MPRNFPAYEFWNLEQTHSGHNRRVLTGALAESEDCRAVAQRRRAKDFRIITTLRATTRHASRDELAHDILQLIFLLSETGGPQTFIFDEMHCVLFGDFF